MKRILTFAVITILFGCGQQDAAGPSSAEVYGDGMQPTSKPDADVPVRSVGDTDADITAAKSKYLIAKTSFQKGTGNKQELVNATVQYGIVVMNGPGAPKQKYPEALKLYSEALKLDPKNEDAIKNKQLILDIYKSMGKNPPKLED